MKKLGTLVLLFTCLHVHAQINELPEAVAKAFKSRYPAAILEDWRSEDPFWFVDYSLNRYSYTAKFDSIGIWLETSELISDFEIPSQLKTYLGEKFPAAKICYCERVENKDSPKFIRVNFFDENRLSAICCDADGKNIRLLKP